MAVFIKSQFKIKKAEVVKEQIKEKVEYLPTLTKLLGKYAENFSIDVDEVWQKCDWDKNGMLDREECRAFIKDIVPYASEDRNHNYDPATFDTLFDIYDEDKNGFIEKTEMAVFIKKTFKKHLEERTEELEYCIDQGEVDDLNETKKGCQLLYPKIRDSFITLQKTLESDDKTTVEKVSKVLSGQIKDFSKKVAKMLGHVFSIHHTNDDI